MKLKDPIGMAAAAREYQIGTRTLRRHVERGAIREERLGWNRFLERADVARLAKSLRAERTSNDGTQ